jgi:endoglucanase
MGLPSSHSNDGGLLELFVTFLHRIAALSTVLLLCACSSTDPDPVVGTGGSFGAGGQPGVGGSGSGGTASGAGGQSGSANGGSSLGGTEGTGNGGTTMGGTSGAAGSRGDDEPLDASALAKDMGFGTNIGNTLENTTTWETGWGQPLITREFIEGLASHGIKTVRVPVAWDTYATDGQVNAAHLSRVKEVVGWILDSGLYAIVNIHWDGGWIFNESNPDEYRLTDSVKTKFASYWQQIATGLGDFGHQLVLEGLNEEGRFYENGDPNQAPDYDALNELNQLFVTTVRAQGGYNATRALLIAGFNTDIGLTCVDAFQVPNDPAGPGRLFLSIHYYTPYTFTLMDSVESWGSPSTVWGSDAEKAELEGLFDKLGAFSAARNTPIILGEFAVTRGTAFVREPASRVLWMTSVAKAAMSRGMVPVLWDTGSEVSRSDGSLSTELESVLDELATQ